MANQTRSRTREVLYSLAAGYFALSAMLAVEAGNYLVGIADVAGVGVFVLLVLTERQWSESRPAWVSPTLLGLAGVAITLMLVHALG